MKLIHQMKRYVFFLYLDLLNTFFYYLIIFNFNKGNEKEEKTYYDLQQELTDFESHKIKKEKELIIKQNLLSNLENSKENMKLEINKLEIREEIKKIIELYKIKIIILECDNSIKNLDKNNIKIEEIKNKLLLLNNSLLPLEKN